MATDRSTRGNKPKGAATFAPMGTAVVARLGVGAGFEVALVKDEKGRELVCKRAAPGARSSIRALALERERAILSAAKSPHMVELVASGAAARGPVLLEAVARGKALRELVGPDGPIDDPSWLPAPPAARRGAPLLPQCPGAHAGPLISSR